MTQRRRLSGRPVEKGAEAETLNREWLPVIQQLTKAPSITGSRSGATIAILQSLLQALQNAGIITDSTTP